MSRFRAHRGCVFFKVGLSKVTVYRLDRGLKSCYLSGGEGRSTHDGKILAQINRWHVVDFPSDIFLVQ